MGEIRNSICIIWGHGACRSGIRELIIIFIYMGIRLSTYDRENNGTLLIVNIEEIVRCVILRGFDSASLQYCYPNI